MPRKISHIYILQTYVRTLFPRIIDFKSIEGEELEGGSRSARLKGGEVTSKGDRYLSMIN